MKDRLLPIGKTIAALALIVVLTNSAAFAGEFDPKLPPSKAEWQHFHKMSESDLTKLWTYQHQRGSKKLADWSWQWRMGWLQRCGLNGMETICPKILLEGLNDQAMVIRAEAATHLGMRFAGKATPELIDALKKTYMDPRNARNGNPLFVCERILEALKNLKDPRATKVAKNLAKRHSETKAYWAKIQKK
jgi:hypothetical protein